MSAYTAGLGSLAISNKDLTRIENLAREMKSNAWALKSSAATDAGVLLARADKTASKVSRAVILNAVVGAIGTAVVVVAAVKTHRAGKAGLQ